jgi:hypothetical protein
MCFRHGFVTREIVKQNDDEYEKYLSVEIDIGKVTIDNFFFDLIMRDRQLIYERDNSIYWWGDKVCAQWHTCGSGTINQREVKD